MPYVSVVIVNWNGKAFLPACLEALQSQTFQDYKVVLVDNGSTDGSVDYLREHFPEVCIIANQENRGFAAATNQGIRITTSRYIATLNNDTVVAPGWLQALIEVAESDPSVGMCASKMLFADYPQMINSTGIATDRIGISWDRLGGDLDDLSMTELVEVFGPCAGAALYRRAMLDEIGLFDEDFFAYMEDVDLAWRGRVCGWRCFYVPQARVLHHHSATAGEGSRFKSFHLGRNKIWLLLKNYPLRKLWYYVPLVVFYDLAALTYTLIARGDVHALCGRLASLKRAKQMWHKRVDCTDQQRTDISSMASIVWPWQVMQRYRHLSAERMTVKDISSK
jgi:hypothetical protein